MSRVESKATGTVIKRKARSERPKCVEPYGVSKGGGRQGNPYDPAAVTPKLEKPQPNVFFPRAHRLLVVVIIRFQTFNPVTGPMLARGTQPPTVAALTSPLAVPLPPGGPDSPLGLKPLKSVSRSIPRLPEIGYPEKLSAGMGSCQGVPADGSCPMYLHVNSLLRSCRGIFSDRI